ncbi:MAG: hypothetical protein EG825_18200, partial [Rhodocyclaceae bacterium]|nr:hypothetical protein [Rhodocyclaceae bacterium]
MPADRSLWQGQAALLPLSCLMAQQLESQVQVRPGRNPDPVREAACLLVLVALALLAFWPVLQNGFVNWDDPAYITRNPLLHLPLPELLRSAWSTFPLGNYHPLTTVGQALLHAVFGPSPLAFHLVSLLTHLCNLLLVYALLRRFGCSVYAAGGATLLFAVHPLRVEAVAWASAQKDLWCTGFVLVALHAYLSYVRSDERRSKRYYGLCLVAFALALLSKGTAMVLPLLLCLVDLALGREVPGRRRWLDKLPFFALAALFGVI